MSQIKLKIPAILVDVAVRSSIAALPAQNAALMKKDLGQKNVPIEHHPTIRYMVYKCL